MHNRQQPHTDPDGDASQQAPRQKPDRPSHHNDHTPQAGKEDSTHDPNFSGHEYGGAGAHDMGGHDDGDQQTDRQSEERHEANRLGDDGPGGGKAENRANPAERDDANATNAKP